MIGRVKALLRGWRDRAPSGLGRAGSGISVLRPYRWEHRERIELGNDVSFLGDSLITPIVAQAGGRYAPKIEIGNGTYIGRSVHLAAMDAISIGPGSVLSDHVYINDAGHGFAPDGGPIMQQPLESRGPVVLGPRCFVGYGARILSGVVLGEGCVVGTGAVVTRSFPAYSMIGGIPAKLLKRYDRDKGVWRGVADDDASFHRDGRTT